MKISVSVNGHLVPKPLRVVVTQPVILERYESDDTSSVAKLVAGVSAGAISRQAWAGFQATHTTTVDEMAKLLMKNGLAPEHAPGVAQRAVDVIQAEPTKLLLVAVSAGGGAWAAVEAGRAFFGLRMSRLWQFVLALAAGIAAALVYYYLRSRGIVN